MKKRRVCAKPIWGLWRSVLGRQLVLVLLLLQTSQADVLNNEVNDASQRVRLKSDEPLTNFVTTSDFVYVGGTNVLYQLDAEDLVVESLVKTGPHHDSSKCHATGCSGATENVTTVLTDNVNKALVVDSENQKLIVCGSLRQGSCTKYGLKNISSSEVDFLPEAVAANDAQSSTFAFIGPQRYNRWGQGNVLYVGTTYTPNGDYRHDVPAISSRNLLDLRFAEYSVSKQSTLRIDVKYRDRFLVKYVYGFNSSSHVYFVTVQKKSHLPGHEEQGYITRIARVCVTDANFDTYTEITLECGDSGHYNIVQDAYLAEKSASLGQQIHSVQEDSFLVASFGKSQGSSNRAQNTSSAVCMYSLSDIDRQFDENIHNCFNGSMHHRNMEYISGTIMEGKCPDKLGASGNILNFCEIGLKISGQHPIKADPVFVTSHEAITAVHYNDVRGHKSTGVLVLGTSSGTVKSVLMAPSAKARVLATQALSDRSAVTKVTLAPQQDFLLALQRHTLTKLPVSECDRLYDECSTCMVAADPFCGWCSMENKCSSRHQCNTRQWVSATMPGGGQCSQIEQVIPSSLSLPSVVGHITVMISALPKLSRQDLGYNCVYGHNVTAVRARLVPGGLQCPIPNAEAFVSYQKSTGAENIQLDIRFADLGTNLVTTQIKLLDCSKAASCGGCTAHPDCHWCLESHQCLPASGDQGACYQTIRGRISGQPSTSCPRLLKSTPIRIANDIPTSLHLTFEHLHSFYNSATEFWCLVHIEEAKFKVSARMIWENATVVCDETLYNYNSHVEETTASVSVLINDDEQVLDTQVITVFKCSVLGSFRDSQDCTLCSLKSKSHGCGWCPQVGCVSIGRCPSRAVLTEDEKCPEPEIFLISPTTGPPEGGTILTIEGSNLGTSIEDLRGRIKVGGQDCKLLALRNAVEATCVVPPQSDFQQQNVTVILLPSRRRKLTSASWLHFRYMDYSLSDFSPSKGAASGGSLVRIGGRNLDIGTQVKAFFDDVECSVDQRHRSSSNILCTTGAVGQERVAQNLTVVIDGARRTLSRPFFYTPDPIVHDIKPTTSFASGGRVITVHGEYLNSITKAELLVYDRTEPVSSACKVLSSRLLECFSPPLKLVAPDKADSRPTEVGISFPIGLRLDNVTAYLFMHRNSLTYVDDPDYDNFTDKVKVYNGDALVIEGRHLNTASDQNDVRVTIGNDYCNVTSLTTTQLLCIPPSQQPPPNTESDYLPRVTVHVGTTLRYQIGHVRYNNGQEEFISSEIIGAISAITAILVSVGIVVLIVLKHKSTQVEREYKRIQIQMDILENNVRSECKQAFAELQTDLTDLTMELETTGIPIVAHQAYIMNVFFPGVSEHPVLLQQMPEWQSHDSLFGFSMSQFEQLILNKTFLLTLVDTVEQQPNFGIRDRVNFASLLSIVLMTRMDYFSEVLRLLLLKQIDRALRSRHPQLMLRRTETVVEKLLTNWLALCLHTQLEQRAGTSLFLLYKAIKCQVEKGPVDMFTQEAKYSLAEEGLLRDSMPTDYNIVSCLVLQRELDEAYHAKVLDCDSITQVKAKILDTVYKNTAFALRPSVHEVDLEWQCGQDAHVVLKDYDLTTKEEKSGVKKVNTLRHYGIKTKAVVSLVPSQFNGATNTLNSLRAYHLRLPDHLGGTSGGVSHESIAKTSKSIIPEVYLTRLLATKGTVKKFIDDFFYTVFSSSNHNSSSRAPGSSTTSGCSGGSESPLSACSSDSLPPCAIKWLFDIFDEAALANNDYIDDLSSVVHAWKSNSVPLRFWITLIKNPQFVFDVEQTAATELNLSIVAQTLMSSCMPMTEPVSKEAPSHRLLFARDINDYRGMINDWYDRVQRMPPVTNQDLNCFLHGLSQRHASIGFNQMAALKEIFLYVTQYYQELARVFGANASSDYHSSCGSTYGSSQHIYASPQSPSMQNHEFSVKLERIFNIVKDCHSDPFLIR